MKVTCDKCHNEFDNMLKQREKSCDGMVIIHTFLQCPNCGEIYTVGYDNHSTLVLAKQIRKHISLVGQARTEKEHEKELKIVRKKQNRLREQKKELHLKYAKEFEER